MEKEKTYTYQGFVFHTEAELKEAQKEAEVVSYVRAQADLSDVKTVLKLYQRLIEKKTMSTVLGIAFLQELRTRALEAGVVAESSLLPLPVPKKHVKDEEIKPFSRDRKLMELYKERTKFLTIVVVILSVAIAVMFGIRLFGKASPFVDYEKKVLDEYASWKEELTGKEAALREKEDELAAWEEELSQREQKLSE